MHLPEVQLPPRSVELALTAILALGGPAVAGCSADQVSPNAGDTVPATAVPATELLPTTSTIPQTPGTLVAPGVVTGPIASQKDFGWTAANRVSDYGTHNDEPAKTAKTAEQARGEIRTLADETIRTRSNRYINFRLAGSVASDHFIPSIAYSKDNERYTHNLEGAVDLIDDATTRVEADKQLDRIEGNVAATLANSSYLPDRVGTAGLLASVEDPEIAALTKAAMDGDKGATARLKDEIAKGQKAIEDQARDAFSSLYNGSNTQAEAINRYIDEFNATVARDGQ